MTFNAPWRPYMRQPSWLKIEWVLLFVLLPVFLLSAPRFVLFGLLWGAAFMAFVYLYRHNKKIFQWHAHRGEWIKVLVRGVFVGLVLFASAFLYLPERFMALPFERPFLWVAIIILYPILSALPQEVLYRAFMRVRHSFLNTEFRFVLASAVAFALAHLMFGNFVALILGLIGGAIFARTYWRTNSFGLVWFEHSLYGILIFTSGWGWYFYLGAGHKFHFLMPASMGVGSHLQM